MGLKVKQAILKVRQMLCLGEAVHYGSISKAAEKNAMKQSNFSVQIKQLEEESGERLIIRLPHGIKLTEAGEKLYALVCDLENVLNKTSDLNLKVFHISGAIRLWTSDGLGIGYLSDCLSDFYLKYPGVNVEILCSLEMPKADQFDMAIVYSEPAGNAFKIIDKFDLAFSLYASKEYLFRFGYPKSLKDIQENHRICNRINYTSVWREWENIIRGAKQVSATTNSSAMLLQLIKNGIGIGLLPQGTADKETDLIRLGKIKLKLHHKFWIVVRKEVKDVDKITALVRFIEEASQKLAG